MAKNNNFSSTGGFSRELGMGVSAREDLSVSWPSRRAAIDRVGAFPLHAQIAELIRDDLEAERLPPGARLPSERELADELGVSVAPVRQALLALVSEGYLERRRGAGTFVRAKVVKWMTTLSGFAEAHETQLASPEIEVMSQQIERVSDSLGYLSPSGPRIFVLRRVARSSGMPVALLGAYLDPLRFPNIEKLDFRGRSLYRTLADIYSTEVTRATSTLDLVRAARHHKVLNVPSGTMVLRVTSTTYADDEPVEYAEIVYRPDCFRFQFESSRLVREVTNRSITIDPKTIGRPRLSPSV